MFDKVLTPQDSVFFDWNYGADECIKQLKLLTKGVTPVVPSVSEWAALSLETQAVAYYQNDFATVKRLIAAISSATLALEPNDLKHFPFLFKTGLRATLCQPSEEIDTKHLIELYRLLPRTPTAKNLDLHIMFQCHFGFTNALSSWRAHFTRYVSEHNWNEYNALQLDAGIALVSERQTEQALIVALEQKFPSFVMATEDDPLAAEWFPWMLWFNKCAARYNNEH